ncbi:MAG: C25 family cysteine peptidase [Candidatus Promineifilaceae bacterium]|nr:C25 family cysteine peptidase [Candidatus Promineifilaceae bacterium]
MSRSRRTVLAAQALLTIFFIAAALLAFLGYPFEEEVLTERALPVGSAPVALRLTVADTGIVALPASRVRSLNLQFDSFSAGALALTRDGESVPFYVAGTGDDAVLYFYGKAITRSVEAPAVYWLAPGRGKTVAQRDHSPDGPGSPLGWQQVRWEQNSRFQPRTTGDDVWLGQHLFAPSGLGIPLTEILPSGGPGQLTVRVWSSNRSPVNPDHHLEIWLNGRRLADHWWDGIRQETLAVPLESGALDAGTNTLVLNLPGDTGAGGESIFLDWIRLDYEGELHLRKGQLHFRSDADNVRVRGATSDALVFDIRAPDAPVLLINTEVQGEDLLFANPRTGPGGTGDHSGSGGAYVALNPQQAIAPTLSPVPDWGTPLRERENGADYIAIIPGTDGFEEALEPLLAHRREQGLRVLEVPLQQIYDEFAHGRQSPEAIRAFLNHARRAWPAPAPRFVLLAGDASFDGEGPNRDLIPTRLVYTDFAGYVPSDAWYVLEGDHRSALAIGRLPAQTAEQLAIMVQKTVDYEQIPGGDWRQQALLVADDEARFVTTAYATSARLSRQGYEIQLLSMMENEELRDTIISTFNHGVGLVNYIGGGDLEAWGDERVLESSDVDLLMNGARLPLFTTFTCLNGSFNDPQAASLAETMLATPNGGIVAAVASSERATIQHQQLLTDLFFSTLLDPGHQTLGDALLQVRRHTMEHPLLWETVHIVNLLGDPALRFHGPKSGS